MERPFHLHARAPSPSTFARTTSPRSTTSIRSSPRTVRTREPIEKSIKPDKERLKRKSQTMIEQADKKFQEIVATLNQEQKNLEQLEEERQHLYKEMMVLKADIEKEKESIFTELEATKADDESIDSWTGLTDDEVERKRSFIIQANQPLSVKFEDLSNDDYLSVKSTAQSANEFEARLQRLTKREN